MGSVLVMLSLHFVLAVIQELITSQPLVVVSVDLLNNTILQLVF